MMKRVNESPNVDVEHHRTLDEIAQTEILIQEEDEQYQREMIQSSAELKQIQDLISHVEPGIVADSVEEGINSLIKIYQERKAKIVQLTDSIKVLESKIQQRGEDHKKQYNTSQQELNNLNQERFKVDKLIEETKKDLQVKDRSKTQLEAKLAETNSLNNTYQRRLESKKNEREGIEAELSNREKEIEELAKQKEQKNQAFKNQEKQLTEVTLQNTALKSTVNALRHKESLHTAALAIVSALCVGYVITRFFIKK